ncbi:MAG: hypothetical protein KKA05_10390 [Alphaproteobacteria bacterium]|nr:hypothetical protein [Alphaproteobacteria bacterium]
MQPNDKFTLDGRKWRITGVHLGGDAQESVVGIEPIDLKKPDAHGEEIPVMYVPVIFIRNLVTGNLVGAEVTRTVAV